MSEQDNKNFEGFNLIEEERKRLKARAQANDKLLTNQQMMGFMQEADPEGKFTLNSQYIYEMISHDAKSIYKYDVEENRMDARALLDLLYQYYNAIGMSSLIAELYYLDRVANNEYSPLTRGGRLGGRGHIVHKQGTEEDQERAETFADLWQEAIYRRHEIAEKENDA